MATPGPLLAITEDKLVPCYSLGRRDAMTALHFLSELHQRIKPGFQLTSDGWPAYRDLVESVWGSDIDFAQLIKMYGATEEGRERYSLTCPP